MVHTDFTSSTDPLTGNEFGIRSGTVTMVQPFQFDQNKRKKFQVTRAIISSAIPNVYIYGSFDNSKIKVSNNGGTSWSTIQFPTGSFTVAMLQGEITDALLQLGWFTDTTKLPITLDYNPATQFVYTILNSSNLTTGTQIAVDYGFTPFYKMLGYSSTANAKLITDGTFSAQNPPKIDTQGTTILFTTSLIQGARYSNGSFSNIICRVPIVTATSTSNEIIFPSATTGLISPIIECSIPPSIMSYNINVLTETGDPMVFMFGNVILELNITDA